MWRSFASWAAIVLLGLVTAPGIVVAITMLPNAVPLVCASLIPGGVLAYLLYSVLARFVFQRRYYALRQQLRREIEQAPDTCRILHQDDGRIVFLQAHRSLPGSATRSLTRMWVVSEQKAQAASETYVFGPCAFRGFYTRRIVVPEDSQVPLYVGTDRSRTDRQLTVMRRLTSAANSRPTVRRHVRLYDLQFVLKEWNAARPLPID